MDKGLWVIAISRSFILKVYRFVTGNTFRENIFTISAKCDEEVKKGMVFVVYLGVNDLKNSAAKDEAGKKYAIAISDTVWLPLFDIRRQT